MTPIPRRFGHYIFAVIQSCLTCAIAAAIATWSDIAPADFFGHWLRSWILSWVTMIPFVILAAPTIRRFVDRITTAR